MSADPTGLQALCDRLEMAQSTILRALDANDAERLPELVRCREADLAALATKLGDAPERHGWARDYLARDREIIARIVIARDVVAARMGDVKRAGSIHRAYLSGGLA